MDDPYQLSDRKRQVLALKAVGLTGEQIADALLIEPDTVKNHLDKIRQQYGVSNTTQAIAAALLAGALTLDELKACWPGGWLEPKELLAWRTYQL
ncbi:MAG: helix-turn-helix domain-containing protein [Ardenticatenaceae bacterium]|nr:helix-turn-helix domain-containing protein [Ardenticatenaceae bacterium]